MNKTPTAFPWTHGDLTCTGMTLRDYFAAKAMQAIMGDRKEQNYWAEDYSIEEMMQFTAERAYEQADAMLKEREA